MYKRIIVPLDGSTLAQSALSEVKQPASLVEAELVLVRVVDSTDRGTLSDVALLYGHEVMAKALETEREEAAVYLTEISAQLAAEGIPVSTKLVDGITSRVMVAMAKPGELTVMSTYGRTSVKRWILGSVAEEVLHHATVPVLLVRIAEARSNTTSEGEEVPERELPTPRVT